MTHLPGRSYLSIWLAIGLVLIAVSCQSAIATPAQIDPPMNLQEHSPSTDIPTMTSGPVHPESLNESGEGSIDTGGINLNQDSLIPPLPPSIMDLFSRQDCLVLAWNGTGSDIVAEYLIYSRAENSAGWELIHNVLVTDNNQGQFEICVDTAPPNSSCIEYALRARDIYGNLSEFSEIVTNGTCEVPDNGF